MVAFFVGLLFFLREIFIATATADRPISPPVWPARVHLEMPPTRTAAALLLLCTVSAVACNRRDAPPGPERETAAPPAPPAPHGPDSFLVALTTSRGPVAGWCTAPGTYGRIDFSLVHGDLRSARFFR